MVHIEIIMLPMEETSPAFRPVCNDFTEFKDKILPTYLKQTKQSRNLNHLLAEKKKINYQVKGIGRNKQDLADLARCRKREA